MKRVKTSSYLKWILLSETAGVLSAILSMKGMAEYNLTAIKPALSPPPVVFPIVWTILYALMGIGAAKVAAYSPSKYRSAGLNLFFVQLTVNFFWSLLFFNAKAYGFAFFWLILLLLLVIAMTLEFYKVNKKAGLLQIPYLLWLLFAAYLNYGVWSLN